MDTPIMPNNQGGQVGVTVRWQPVLLPKMETLRDFHPRPRRVTLGSFLVMSVQLKPPASPASVHRPHTTADDGCKVKSALKDWIGIEIFRRVREANVFNYGHS